MEWENIKGNVIFIIGGLIAALLIFGLENKQTDLLSRIHTLGAYLVLIIGIINFIVLLYKTIEYLL
jgi:hypothetical protein